MKTLCFTCFQYMIHVTLFMHYCIYGMVEIGGRALLTQA